MNERVFKQRIKMMGYDLVEDNFDYVIKYKEEGTGNLFNIARVSKRQRFVMDTDLDKSNIPEELFELLVVFSSTDVDSRKIAKRRDFNSKEAK